MPYHPGKLLLGLALVPLLMNAAQADSASRAISEAERQSAFDAIKTLKTALEQHPRNARLLTRLSEEHSEASELYAKKGDKSASAKAAKDAVSLAQQAITLDGRLGEAHLALAVAYGRETDHLDSKRKMQRAPQIRDEALRALELNPRLDMAHHLLGRWYYGIATLNPALKLAARALYGKLPEASTDQAISHMEKAVTLKPRRIVHHWHLARILDGLGRRDEARRHWEKVVNLPASESDDAKAKQEAAKALRRR